MSFVSEQATRWSSIVVLPLTKDVVNFDNILAAVMYTQLLSNDKCFLVYHDEGHVGFNSLRETVEIARQEECFADEQLLRIVYLGFTPTHATEIDYLVQMRFIVRIFDCTAGAEQSYLNNVRHVKRRWKKDRCVVQQLVDTFPALQLSKDMQRILQIVHFLTFYDMDFKVWENEEMMLLVSYLMHDDCVSEFDVMSESVEYVNSTVSIERDAVGGGLEHVFDSGNESQTEENLTAENDIDDVEPVCTLADVGLPNYVEKLIPFILLEWLLLKLQNDWNFLYDCKLSAANKMKCLVKHTNSLIYSIQSTLADTSQGFLYCFNTEQFIQNYMQLKEELGKNGVLSSIRLKSQCVQTFTSLLCVVLNQSDFATYFLPAAKEVMEQKGCQYIVSFTPGVEKGGDGIIFLVKTFIERGNCLAVAKELEQMALSTTTGKIFDQSWKSKAYGTSWRAGGLLTFDMLGNLFKKLKIIKRLQI